MCAAKNNIIEAQELIEEAKKITETLKAREKDWQNGPSNELIIHFNIVLGAISQVADGKIKAIHPSVNASLIEIPKILREARRQWVSMTCYDDVVEMRERIERLAKTLPALGKIAQNFIDYAPEAEKEHKRGVAR